MEGKYSLEFKLKLIKEFKESNLSLVKFCLNKNISLQTFITWKKKYDVDPEIQPLKTSEIGNSIQLFNNDVVITPGEIGLQEEPTCYIKVKNVQIQIPLSNLKKVIEVLSND